VNEHAVGDHSVFLAAGTPADCVGLGLHNLYPDCADIVLSGINVGTNASLPFYLNSGTLGGARQALAFGVRGIGFSALVPEEVFRLCREDDRDVTEAYAGDWQRLSLLCARIAGALLDEQCWRGVDLYSCNLPWTANPETPVVITRLARMKYFPLYVKHSEGRYEHHFSGFGRYDDADEEQQTSAEPDDLATLHSGSISLTPISYRASGVAAGVEEASQHALRRIAAAMKK
jgi:5'-nucleotidase